MTDAARMIWLLAAYIAQSIRQSEDSRAAMAAEAIRKPGETVECLNAVVMVDSRGEISWFDKRKRIIDLRED